MDERGACLDSLGVVLARLRQAQQRSTAPALQERLRLLRAWQAQRLAAEYADQRAMPRRRQAVEFFLEDVYGARDFGDRDAQFSRAIHKLEATLPLGALRALRDAVELQALTLELDLSVAERLAPSAEALDAAGYGRAYRETGRRVDRMRQIDLAVDIGRRLEHLTALPAIELVLRLAAAPARLAGFGALQAFIERGHAAFRRLGPEASAFLDAIEARERAFLERHAAADVAPPLEASQHG